MTEKFDEMRARLATVAGQIRERVFALFCLTVIAIVAMFKLDDQENITINVIVGITSFVGGVAVGAGTRKSDSAEPGK